MDLGLQSPLQVTDGIPVLLSITLYTIDIG